MGHYDSYYEDAAEKANIERKKQANCILELVKDTRLAIYEQRNVVGVPERFQNALEDLQNWLEKKL